MSMVTLGAIELIITAIIRLYIVTLEKFTSFTIFRTCIHWDWQNLC